LLITVTGDNPLELAIVLPDNESAELIDIYRFPFEAVLQGPDLHPVFKSTGKTFPFPDDCFIFSTFNEEIPALELFEDTCEKGCTVHFMPDFSADRSDIFL
jgi:hypothetical protein